MADAYCACIIANVEGAKRLVLPSGNEGKPTLEVLDSRTRRIEARNAITPPPPMLEATWDSLTWRVCRIARLRPTRKLVNTSPPLSDVISLQFLRSIVTTLSSRENTRLEVGAEKENADDKSFLPLVAQWLCYIAGQRGYQVDDITFELKSVCSLAIDLSLELEGTTSGFIPGGPIQRSPIPPAQRANCCNCCVNRRPPPIIVPSIASTASSRSARCASWRPFGWIKKLAFWRRKRVTDDDSSSLASTLAD